MTDPSPAPSTALPFATASWGRRVVALFVDWVASWLVVALILGWDDVVRTGSSASTWTLLVYVVESVVLTTLAGGSFGKLATRLRTVRTTPAGPQPLPDPRPLDPLRTIARQILIAVVVPPLIFRPDGRGLHDLAAGTATVTLQTYRDVFLRKS